MKKLNVIDLFSGCGGISCGFSMVPGYRIVGAIDFEKAACNTFKNHFKEANVICGDINEITVKETGFKDIDIIVGGPPCQGFSGLNRWEKDKENDPRNVLFFQYLRFVDELKPKAIMIENVKQVLTLKNGYVPFNIKKFLEERGYNVTYEIVDASEFGVPQKRERAIFIALKKEYGEFDFNMLEKYKLPKVTVLDALSDIAEIESFAKQCEQGTVYKVPNSKSDYQKLMQNKEGKLYNHMIYYPTESVQEKIKYVPQGGNWKNVPEHLFKTVRNNRHSNYLKRLDNSSQSITIDTGHNVYFHPDFNRVPTIRESARLQSFPDNFVFSGNKGQQFKQVGNAVPPLLAMAFAKALKEILNRYEEI